MPNWYWEKKNIRNTPSQEKGMHFDTETRYRREGVRFIFELGKTMNLYHLTMATSAVYFHRFYMFHAFQDFPRFVVATCCLFLAGKAEETPKKCRDIVRIVKSLTNERQFATFGQDPREGVVVLERVLLQTIKFDLQVDHPYSSIIKFAKTLRGDQAKLNKMVQMSWTFVNDSLCTTLCLQWEPEIIAIAVMHLAVKLSKFEVKDWANRQEHHKDWWDQFVENLDTNDLEEICHQVLDLYTQPTTPTKDAGHSPPQTTSGPTKKSGSQPPPLPPPPAVSKRSTPPPPKPRPQTPPPPPVVVAAASAGKPPVPAVPAPPVAPAGAMPQPPGGYPPQGPQYHHPQPPQGPPPPPPPPPQGNYPPPGSGGYPYPPGGNYRPSPLPGGYMPVQGGPPPPPPNYQQPPGFGYPPPHGAPPQGAAPRGPPPPHGAPPPPPGGYYQGGPPPPGNYQRY